MRRERMGLKWVVVNFETENEVWTVDDKPEERTRTKWAKTIWNVAKFFLI